MVQRKAPNRLGVQAEHDKSEKKRLASLKPSSQHQDGKNKGGSDLKKKMKKSRSMKLSDFESLRSSTLRREVPQPGRPPLIDVAAGAAIQQKQNVPASAAAATPQKQSVIRTSDGSPNYMKSTSSSDARKERPQVSNRNTPTSSDSKSSRRRNSNYSKLGSVSGHKLARTLTKTSSLELVRTLTKTPSFKPARTSAKKCSPVALCADINVQRATCSSTLKDAKFPAYLMLSPGGTESEGTSVLKVCPYNYCSLNGHHHTPLPPLKCFMSARRRLLKTQKSMKLVAQSPRGAKPTGDKTKEFDTNVQLICDQEAIIQEVDLGSSAISPLLQEEGMDFFIEIYARKREDTAENIGEGIHDGDEEIIDFAGELEDLNDTISSAGCSEETAAEQDGGQGGESMSDEPPHSEIDFEVTVDQSSDITFSDMDITEYSPENDQKAEAVNEDFSPSLLQEERALQCIGDWCESVSETIDMDWEEEQFSLHLNDEAKSSIQCDDESDFKSGYLSEIENPNLNDEPIFKPDYTVSKSFDDIPTEILEEYFGEERASFEAQVGECDSESDSMHQNSETEVFDELIAAKEKDESAEIDGFIDVLIVSTSTEKPVEPMTATEEGDGASEAENEIPVMEPQLINSTNNCIGLPDEALMGTQENEFLQYDDVNALLRDQISANQNEKNETEDSGTDKTVAASSLGLKQELSTADVGDTEERKEQVDDTKALVGSQSHKIIEVSQLDVIVEESKSSQGFANESLLAKTKHDLSDELSQGSNIIENQNPSDEDRKEAEKFKISSYMVSEGCSKSGMKKFNSTECSIEDINCMEVEDGTKSDAEYTFLKAYNVTGSGIKKACFHAGSNSNQGVANTCNNLKLRNRCKRSIEEDEEQRKFNPREPNYFPVEPGPEAEKVDLRHQEMDARKNTEEWMLDHALQQAVTKLAPARKKRVALLVEAFETVMPMPKCETHMRHPLAAFSHVRQPVQACS